MPRSRLLHRVVAIIDELRGSLNLEPGGEIAANMADLYDYSSRQLLRANLENRADLLDEVANCCAKSAVPGSRFPHGEP